MKNFIRSEGMEKFSSLLGEWLWFCNSSMKTRLFCIHISIFFIENYNRHDYTFIYSKVKTFISSSTMLY